MDRTPSYFMGLDGFVWFTGVVEDRNDPEALGRVRVRCIGFHSDNIVDLPTDDLPWAHVMHPVTDPAMHGMGNSPSFLVEGTYVIGFFRDSVERQQPIIIGSLPGSPIAAADPREGFNDPRGKKSKQPNYAYDPIYGPYPVDGINSTMSSGHSFGESDTNRLAQGEASETHQSLINRRLMRLSGDPTGTGNGVPTATKPNIDKVDPLSTAETRGFWEEPHPKGYSETAEPYVSSQYPYNHVHESESGHIHEIDDSPGAERLMTQHKSGTFEELHANGDKVVKVIGDEYKVVIGGSNVSITGNVNLTISGTVREYIKGDYHLEVEGDYTQKIGGSVKSKIGAKSGGNHFEEIIGNHGYAIVGSVVGVVGKDGGGLGESDKVVVIKGDEQRIVNGSYKLETIDGIHLDTGDNFLATAGGNSMITSGTVMALKAGTVLRTNSGSHTLMKSESSGSIDIFSAQQVQVRSGGGTPNAVASIQLNPTLQINFG